MRCFIIMESLIKHYPTIQRFLSLCIALCMSDLLCSPFMQSTWPRPLNQEPDGGQDVRKKAAAGVSMEKNEKISVSIDR